MNDKVKDEMRMSCCLFRNRMKEIKRNEEMTCFLLNCQKIDDNIMLSVILSCILAYLIDDKLNDKISD